jgi:hypothetical protein
MSFLSTGREDRAGVNNQPCSQQRNENIGNKLLIYQEITVLCRQIFTEDKRPVQKLQTIQ